jgi:Zn-finger nucleic acid-binding protein
MRWLMAILYRVRYLEVVRDERDRVSIEVACPHCREVYFAEAGELEPRDIRDAARAARFKLADECPDHAHRSELD